MFTKSVEESFPFFQSTKEMLKFYQQSKKRLCSYFDFVDEEIIDQYIHDIFIYDRGKNIEDFIKNAGLISLSKLDEENKKIALRVLSKTYFVKDEVFCSHQMISPLKKYRDQLNWSRLGKGFHITRINRPHFDIFGISLEFDMSPKTWMLKLNATCSCSPLYFTNVASS